MQVFYPSLHLVLVSMMLNSHLDVCSRSWSLPSPMTSDAYGVYAACSTRFLENILVHTGMSCLSSCRMTQWSTPLPAPSMLPWNSVPWVLEMASVHSLKPNNHYSPRLRLNLRERDWARKIKWNMSLLNDLLRSLMVQGWRSLLFTNECDRTLLLFLCLRLHTKACQPPIHSHDMVLHVLPHSDTEYVPKKKDC